MLDRPRIVKEGNEGEEDEDEEDDEDEELPSYLREQSSDEEHAALYSKNKLNANGEPLTFPIFIFSSPVTIFFPFLSFSFSLLRLSRFTFDAFLPPPPPPLIYSALAIPVSSSLILHDLIKFLWQPLHITENRAAQNTAASLESLFPPYLCILSYYIQYQILTTSSQPSLVNSN